ncbi:hypothetical protein AVEN_200040-1 [Araneus ventricosus]|uniref:Uncharacterized protein n=1 Tax=Araneus ventricosus TaxID=182803 RepID=A0A4Y2U6D7_ARAVE|nr:hypothetical protein AVEN_61691-1 [Araneus ventricosus]GBO08569.1 hypothetical protein AVEN_200040-1 [Araneus ventricosus]
MREKKGSKKRTERVDKLFEQLFTTSFLGENPFPFHPSEHSETNDSIVWRSATRTHPLFPRGSGGGGKSLADDSLHPLIRSRERERGKSWQATSELKKPP